MEEDAVTICRERPVSRSLNDDKLSDDISIEQDGDYNIDNEERLPFEYKKVLGNGWSAVVEKVEHKQTKELFAKKVIKFPRNKGKARGEAEDRYYNEAAIIRSLRTHSHVIRLFATYTTPRSGGLLLQPAADEGDLQDYLDRFADLVEQSVNKSADLEKMTKVLEQAFGCLSSGLAYMHSKGIRHKDIKPGNILVHKGMVVYTDFGASKDTAKDGQCTTEGAPESLTRRYCAPEVLDYEKRNFAADVFSLGCVFVEMLLRLSHLSEPEGLEDDGYSGIMDSLHILLQSAQIPSNLSFLIAIVIVMTARDALGRSASDKVSDTICSQKDFSCSDCRRIPPSIPAISQPQPEWNMRHGRYLHKQWDELLQHYYWLHYVDGEGWVFFQWAPTEHNRVDSVSNAAAQAAPTSQRRTGQIIQGTYDHARGTPNGHYEQLDSSYFVRDSTFFQTGKVFSVLFSEGADSTVTQYNDSISLVKYGEYVHSQIRRFVVARTKQGFAYSVPIFTYNNQGTKKPGVVPSEHAIAFSYGLQPLLLPGEEELEKEPICIVMSQQEPPLSTASRIFFGIQHPIQYNVKVKDLGYVHPKYLSKFLGYWAIEHHIGTM